MEEAKKRDQKAGKQLGLFMLRDEGPGFSVLPAERYDSENTLLDYWERFTESRLRRNLHLIMLSCHLWETSGHWDHYKEKYVRLSSMILILRSGR